MSLLIRSALKINNFTEPLTLNTEYNLNPLYGIIFSIIQIIFIIFLLICIRRGNRPAQPIQNVDYHIAAIIHR